MRIGRFVAQFEASDVLNDPIEELLDLAIFSIAGRSGMRRVCFWMEPEGFAVEIWPTHAVTVGVRVYYDESMVPPGLSPDTARIHQCAVQRRALATALYEPLSDLLEWRGETARVESDRLWNPSDPSTSYPAKLIQLERLLVAPPTF
jgi:hypothetical protein